MELILKPTAACDFNCSFCSAYGLDIKHDPYNVPDKIKELILKINPRKIIVTGGEPLMMDPSYYYKLHEISNIEISITSNLKDFYLNPEKWKELFNEKWFRVGTSFQYGDNRMWNKNTVYTEEMFLEVFEKFKECTGKVIPFIATIDETNEHLAIDHVLLARKLNTTVKLNNVLGFGKQETTYPRYKMFKIYIELFKLNLWMYEANCIERRASKCPYVINRGCQRSIRCAYVDNNEKLHLHICDDMASLGIEIDPETDKGSCTDGKLDVTDLINDKCIYCELCRLCNRCNSQRIFAKKDPNYCEEMLKLEPELKKVGWLL